MTLEDQLLAATASVVLAPQSDGTEARKWQGQKIGVEGNSGLPPEMPVPPRKADKVTASLRFAAR